jgi:hypothetical protein
MKLKASLYKLNKLNLGFRDLSVDAVFDLAPINKLHTENPQKNFGGDKTGR